MADTWRDQLLPASFRGETFLIEDTSVPVGRKVQLHEYPKRDQAFAEQMGKVARVHKVRAFIIGDDCFARRDKLLTALEKEGEGTLVHPWLGQLSVVPGACEMSHSRREGGMVSFDLTFYPGNEVQNPSVRSNTAKMLGQTSASYWSGALDRYRSAMAKVDTARINLIGLQNQVAGVFGILSGQFSPLSGVIGTVTSMAQMLINAPGSLSGLFTGYFSDLGLSSLVPKGSEKKSSASAAAFDSYTTAVATVSSQAEDASTINEVAGGSGGDTTAAAQALSDLVQDALLVQAAATVAEMPVVTPPEADAPAASVEQQLIDPTERPEVPVADDVIAARDELDEVFWQAALKSDASYYPLVNATRQHVVRHLTAVAASGARLETVTPLETSPALVLAFRHFGDATREGEVVQRNKITHPGFVPAAPLQIARE